jgi:hypothetical protein
MGTAVRAQADHGACAGQQHIGGEVKESRGGGEAEMLTGVTMFSSERKSLRWPAAVQTAHCSSGRGYGGEARRKKRRGRGQCSSTRMAVAAGLGGNGGL